MRRLNRYGISWLCVSHSFSAFLVVQSRVWAQLAPRPASLFRCTIACRYCSQCKPASSRFATAGGWVSRTSSTLLCGTSCAHCPVSSVVRNQMVGSRRGMNSSSICQGFVGEATQGASNYYANDFEWEDLRADPDTKAALERQAQQAQCRHPMVPLQVPSAAWEAFHARDNATSRFYKERRYLLLEFPQLAVAEPPQHIVEIGCGCGSALLPLLKGNPTCRVSATDVSPTAVRMFLQAAATAGIETTRISALPWDTAQPEASPLAGLGADACLLIFTLGAVDPCQMHHMLHAAWQALRPGGLLMVRDHGMLDVTQLRLSGGAATWTAVL